MNSREALPAYAGTTPIESGGAKKWFELPQPPNTIRVTYLPEGAEQSIVVVDVPSEKLELKGYVVTGNNMQIQIPELREGSFFLLSEFLENYGLGNKKINVPEDSPIRELPGIKFEIPPPPGRERVGWMITHMDYKINDSMLEPDDNSEKSLWRWASLPFTDIPEEQYKEIFDGLNALAKRRFELYESEDVLDRKLSEDIKIYFGDMIYNCRERLQLNLTTPMLIHLGIEPDPESPAYEYFERIKSAIQKGGEYYDEVRGVFSLLQSEDSIRELPPTLS